MSSPPPTPPARTIRIPEEVAKAMEARIEGSGFANVDDFVSFVLARLSEQPAGEPFSEEDERRLRERLRSLGYID
jgi:Arc/MetJ-type ribon-helix-helix transcriptional regulator